VSKALRMTIGELRRDTDERIKCLRLQTMAWRQLAMIALVDPESARLKAQWLLFNTVPFTNGPAVENFIEETEQLSTDCAVKAGVVSLPS
jgi:hypothetical protein